MTTDRKHHYKGSRMVSLGRVVAAPKPINLPSQRFEHDPTSTLMNDPSIKLVNRGGERGSNDSSSDNNNNNNNNDNNQNGESSDTTANKEQQHNLPERVGEAAADGELRELQLEPSSRE
ncbi:unnamed protein product [Bathycoccus prasinos]